MLQKTRLLLTLLMGSIAAYLIFPGARQSDALACCASSSYESGAQITGAAEKPNTNKITVYYFHNTIRCATCMRMEEYSEFAILAGFPEELKNGRIEWRVVSLQTPENKHFVEEFRLRMSALVIVRFKNGKQVEWRNLEKVWEHVGDLDDFMKYVQSNVKAFLKAK